jgi:hypothetical protein
MAEHKVGLEVLGKRGVLCTAAYDRLGDVLGRESMGDIDEAGYFEIVLKDVRDFEEALNRAWNAMATAAADDHFVFAEHPNIPQHWKRKGIDGLPGALP